MKQPKRILPVIVLSQFLCTSLWFAGNGVLPELQETFGLSNAFLGSITSAVQFGFIVGTLLFALLSIPDRFSPSKVFFTSGLLAALFNLGMLWNDNTMWGILAFRFFTGFFLAGIYPVGMKIAADYYQKGLGKSLGYLVGALVIGTASPHLLNHVIGTFRWQIVLITISGLAFLGGLLMLVFVPNGPYRKPSQKLRLRNVVRVFKAPRLRSAAFGYFGHMWELYTFWAFVPVLLGLYQKSNPDVTLNIPQLSFLIIGVGALACVIGGFLAQKQGDKRIAFLALLLSCICCLVSPLAFKSENPVLFIGFLLFWGMVVIADSPLFSTLVARNAPAELKGTALTIVNSIGFFITIISIQVLNELSRISDSITIFMVLAVGPIIGLIALQKKRSKAEL